MNIVVTTLIADGPLEGCKLFSDREYGINKQHTVVKCLQDTEWEATKNTYGRPEKFTITWRELGKDGLPTGPVREYKTGKSGGRT